MNTMWREGNNVAQYWCFS